MKRTRINPVSKKKRATDREWPAARAAAIERDGGDCVVCGTYVGDAAEVHHKLRRAQGGTHELDNLITLCTKDHVLVHAYPALSYKLGYLVRSTS